MDYIKFDWLCGLHIDRTKIFRYQSEIVAFISIVFSIILTNIGAIAGVLYLKTRKKGTSNITNYINEEIQNPNIKKIWQTSAIISVSTLIMVGGLVMAIVDISGKWEKQKPQNKLSFGVYDI